MRRRTPSPRERARLADAAQMYWVEGQKVEVIARALDVSRSTVSRMLARARQERIIEFTVHRHEDSTVALRRDLAARYGVGAAVPPVDEDVPATVRRHAVGEEAAAWLAGAVSPGTVITVSWGLTVEAMSACLRRGSTTGVHVVQLHGSGNVASIGENYAGEVLGRFGAAFGARVHLLPVPAVLDSEQARDVMWAERSVREVVALRDRSDVLITSIGTSNGETPSRLYSSGYITQDDLDALEAQHVVGNLGSTFFRADGTSDRIDLNRRTTGMPLDQVRRIPRRLLVVAEPRKATALHAALASGLATHVVVDPATARELLRQGAPSERLHGQAGPASTA